MKVLDFKLLPWYAFFWVIPWHLNFICQCLETLCLFHLRRRLRRWNRQSVPKHRHIKFRRWGITQKKTHDKMKVVCVGNILSSGTSENV